MSRNRNKYRNKYAGAAAARKGDPYFLTPSEWKAHLARLDYGSTRALYSQLEKRGGDDWDRIKDLFVDALLQKQKEAMTNDD